MIITKTEKYLHQLRYICNLLTDDQLAEQLQVLNGSSIGGHLRHILEFYLCLLNNEKREIVNYDNRKRDRELETNKNKCMETIDFILGSLFEDTEDYELKLYVNYSNFDNNIFNSVNTSFYRELAYNLDHIVHHLAIIKIGVNSFEKPVSLDENVGVAISTIRNNNNKKACVK